MLWPPLRARALTLEEMMAKMTDSEYAVECFLAAITSRVSIITSAGAAATQTVMHLHVHVVPRRDGDGLALPWTGQRKDGKD